MGQSLPKEECRNPLKVEAGRKGGNATVERYGRDQVAYWGKYGKPGGNKPGRPRSRTPNDVRQRQLLEQRNNGNKEVKGFQDTSNVRVLKKLLKLQRGRSSPSAESEPAGMAQETPEPTLPERVQS